MTRTDKWSEKWNWAVAWSEVGLEDEIRHANCPLHPTGRLIFLAGYQYIYPDGTRQTIAAGWICSSCYRTGRVPIKIHFNLDGTIDYDKTEWATIAKISSREYVEMTKYAGTSKPSRNIP